MRPETLELALHAPDALDEGLAAVRGLPDTVAAGTSTRDRTLLDTFDGRLRSAGLAAHQDAGGPVEGDPGPDVRGLRALLPVARVRSQIWRFAVLDAEDKTVVRLEVEAPAVVRPRQPDLPLTPRLHVRGVLGYPKPYTRALRALALDGRWRAAEQPLFDEASWAVGRDPSGTSSKPGVRLHAGTRADEAAGLLLVRLADIAEANLAGTVDDLDTEFLHDLRVAVRRARSVLRELKGVLDPAARDAVRRELRWVQAATGEVRDLDVQLLDWEAMTAQLDPARQADLVPLRELLVERRTRALELLRRDLAGAGFAETLEAWRALAIAPPATEDDPDRPRAALPVEQVAADRIRRVHQAMCRDGAAIDDASPDEALHDLRKRGKELRYLLELFGDLFPDDVVKPMVKALKQLQDVLGRFQDGAVQAELLREAGTRLARRREGPPALMALGLAVEALHQEQRAARAEFAERFAAFSARGQRRVVKATFPALETA